MLDPLRRNTQRDVLDLADSERRQNERLDFVTPEASEDPVSDRNPLPGHSPNLPWLRDSEYGGDLDAYDSIHICGEIVETRSNPFDFLLPHTRSS